MAVLHFDAHCFEGEDRVTAEIMGGIGDLIEVAAAVEWFRAFGVLEVEVFKLRAYVERVAEVRGALDLLTQDEAGVAGERGAIRVVNVAEHARDAGFLRAPGDELERRRVGPGEHVGFIDSSEALDAGAIKAHPLGEGLFKLFDGDRKRLERSDDVGEPEADELNVVFAAGGDDVAGGIGGHGITPAVAGCATWDSV